MEAASVLQKQCPGYVCHSHASSSNLVAEVEKSWQQASSSVRPGASEMRHYFCAVALLQLQVFRWPVSCFQHACSVQRFVLHIQCSVS